MASAGTARWLALGAVVGPILFTLSWLVLGLLAPGFVLVDVQVTPHSGIALPVSALSFGSTGVFMRTAFLVCGVLLLAGVVGTFQSIREMDPNVRWSCITLLALSPLGAIVCGIVPPGSMSLYAGGFALGGYAEGIFLAVASPVISFLVTGLLLRTIPRWRRFGSWLLVGSPLTLVLLVIFLATFNPLRVRAAMPPIMILLRLGGLMERLLITEVEAWFVALGWLAFRSHSTRLVRQ